MVVILPPPPTRPVNPLFATIPEGTRLVRIFDPTRHGATALSFRKNGPRLRFDHHRASGMEPADDPDRAVYYGAQAKSHQDALASCIVEVFGDTGVLVPGDTHVAMPKVIRDLTLLDLRDAGAMRAGTVAAIAKCEHVRSQPWSRHFYENTGDFGMIDGVFYRNAHNDGPALMLHERAEGMLICEDAFIVRLDHPALRPLLVEIMNDHNLVI